MTIVGHQRGIMKQSQDSKRRNKRGSSLTQISEFASEVDVGDASSEAVLFAFLQDKTFFDCCSEHQQQGDMCLQTA